MRFDDEFLRMFVIFCCFEAPILRPVGTIRCKKRNSETKMQKTCKKGSAGHTVKTVPGAVGPLNKQDNETVQKWDNQTLTQTRPGVPSGTVADIYLCFLCFGRNSAI